MPKHGNRRVYSESADYHSQLARTKFDSKHLRWGAWVAACSLLLAAEALAGNSGPPAWAYGTELSPASQSAPKTDRPKENASENGLLHVPGSTLEFTRAQINNLFGPADWFPQDHPKMPAIVAYGQKPEIWACALCHYPNGKGRAENAGVSGLPVSYFIEQMHEFREGNRASADTRKKNTARMAAFAKAMTDDQIKQAADYFGAIKWTPWIQVKETNTVPKNYLSVGMYLPLKNAGTEPLGNRIIEMPVDPEATEVLRNPRSGFVAYVPVGSVARGKKLVTGGGGKTIACADCHGTNLLGLGPVPGIAGRSPSYLVRQLYDMQQGTRKGTWTELMKPVVARLSEDDMLNIAAYTASLRCQSVELWLMPGHLGNNSGIHQMLEVPGQSIFEFRIHCARPRSKFWPECRNELAKRHSFRRGQQLLDDEFFRAFDKLARLAQKRTDFRPAHDRPVAREQLVNRQRFEITHRFQIRTNMRVGGTKGRLPSQFYERLVRSPSLVSEAWLLALYAGPAIHADIGAAHQARLI